MRLLNGGVLIGVDFAVEPVIVFGGKLPEKLFNGGGDVGYGGKAMEPGE